MAILHSLFFLEGEGAERLCLPPHRGGRPHAYARAPAPRPAVGHALASVGAHTPAAPGGSATAEAAVRARAPAMALTAHGESPPKPVAFRGADDE
jgi:hypothetical protein